MFNTDKMNLSQFRLQNLTMIVLLSGIYTGCDLMYTETGNGNITEEIREINQFDEVVITGNYQVIFEKERSDGNKVIITTDENLLPYINTYTRGTTLVIETDGRIKSDEGIHVTVTYDNDNLNHISISGAATVKNKDKLKSEKLEISMSGAGAADLEVLAETLQVSLSGAGSVKLRGETQIQRVNLSGAGSLEAFELRSDKAFISISGVGGAQVTVLEELDADVSGVGGITYRGDPVVHKSISGLGKVVSQKPSEKY